MKRIIFSIVGSMLISVGAIQAQQPQYDTAGRASNRPSIEHDKQRYDEADKSQDQNRQDRDQAWLQQSDQNQGRDSYASEGMVIIDKDEIPSALKKKLKDDKYEGWENATIYHNTTTGEYVIAPRAYRFDEQGNEIQSENLGYGNRDSQNTGQTPAYSDRDRQDDMNRSSQRDDQQSQYQNRDDRSSETQTDQSTQSQTYDPATGYQNSGQPSQDRADDQSTQNRTYDQSQNQTYDTATQDQTSAGQQRSYQESGQAEQDDTGDQTQSSGYRTNDDQSVQTDDQSTRADGSGQSTQDEFEKQGMVEIQAEQIPAALRSTLSDEQFSGWEEKGTLYQHPATNEYILVMDSDKSTSQSQRESYNTESANVTYRFDKNGKLKEDNSKQ